MLLVNIIPKSFLGKIESTTTNLLGNVIGQDTVVSVAHKLNTAVTTGRNARELLRNGAVVQLVSKSAGSLLQVVMSTNGVLIFDGNGAANSFNTYFTVEEAEKGRLRFHNNYNYLAFEGKLACIMSFPPGAKNNTSIDFRVHDILGSSELVALESCAYKNHFISISPDGLLKTTNIKDKNIDAQFSVVPIINNQQMMYPQQTQPHQLYNMSPYSSIPSMDSQSSSTYHEQSQSLYPQPPMYHEQSQPLYPQPPMYQQQQHQPPPSTSLENSSFLGKIESTTTNLLGNVIGQDTVVSVAHKLNTAVTTGRNARELLRNGAIVQLVSKSAGSLLQVVMSTNGVLIFDGNGAANSFNTYFTVEEAEKGRLRFHNNYNYLAFEGKLACIMSFPPGAKNNTSIDFRVHDILGTSELVALESCAYKNHFISISPDGLLKTTNMKDKNIDAQFSVVPIINNQQMMYPQQTQPHQLYNMSPYSSIPSNNANVSMDSQPSSMYHDQSQSLYPQPPKYHEQSQPLYPQPPMYQQQQHQPPPSTSLENSSYATQSPYNQSTTSSSLYPKFN
ncbi:unnamed protein product [Adineta steineri]|uniref:Uncharacterized protein n=1 Tax=Adineta steineri TaxID=433720 RepID=A0A814DYQ8_9BILA|nr:unnamed protein product [Adineta steineri]